MPTELIAAVDEVVDGLLGLEHSDKAELLDAEAQARLHFGHAHEDFFARLVVERQALTRATARDQDLHAEIAEDRIARGVLYRLACARLLVVQHAQSVLC